MLGMCVEVGEGGEAAGGEEEANVIGEYGEEEKEGGDPDRKEAKEDAEEMEVGEDASDIGEWDTEGGVERKWSGE